MRCYLSPDRLSRFRSCKYSIQTLTISLILSYPLISGNLEVQVRFNIRHYPIAWTRRMCLLASKLTWAYDLHTPWETTFETRWMLPPSGSELQRAHWEHSAYWSLIAVASTYLLSVSGRMWSRTIVGPTLYSFNPTGATGVCNG